MPTKVPKSSRRVVFCRIGLMTFYCGAQEGDEGARGAGDYPDSKKHERYNFAAHGGLMYGYVHGPRGSAPRLSRIDPGCKGNELDDVLVVFLGGQVVVGWYRSASVSNRVIAPTGALAKHRQRCGYVCTCAAIDAVLLPSNARYITVPHGKGGTGTSNVTYRFDERLNEKKAGWIPEVLDFVDNYDGPNLVNDPLAEIEDDVNATIEGAVGEASGQGFSSSPEARRAVEERAMDLATSHYEEEGWMVQRKGKPYDLLCRKGTKQLHVEVKGTQLEGSQILLTRNEVKFAKKHSHEMALFVVSGITVKTKKGSVAAKGGHARIVAPWKPQGKLLAPISFWYRLGGHE